MSPDIKFWSQRPTREDKQLEIDLRKSLDEKENWDHYPITLIGPNKDKIKGYLEPNLRYLGLVVCRLPSTEPFNNLVTTLRIFEMLNRQYPGTKEGDFEFHWYAWNEKHGVRILNKASQKLVDRVQEQNLSKVTVERSVVGFIRDLESQTGLKIEPRISDK